MAFARVAGNKGADTPASEGVRASNVKREAGVSRFLDDLRATLKDGSFRPLPARERMIPKPGGSGSCGCCVTAVGLVFLAGAGSDVSSDHVNLYGDLRVPRGEGFIIVICARLGAMGERTSVPGRLHGLHDVYKRALHG